MNEEFKRALKSFKKKIKDKQNEFNEEDYFYIPEQKYYDEGYIQGMINSMIWFEKYMKYEEHRKEENIRNMGNIGLY